MSSMLIVVVATSLLSSLLTAGILYTIYRRSVVNLLDKKVEEIREISREAEGNIARGVKLDIKDAFREYPTSTVRQTTRSVARIGTGLVEGGLSSLFTERKKAS